MYVVIVKFEAKLEKAIFFKELLLKQANNSLQKETECHQFDVIQDEKRRNIFYLYETYTDRKAFDQHLASKHFKKFDQSITELVLKKDVFLGEQQS